MKRIGLTGGIGVGKTYVSDLLLQLGIPVFNADDQAKKCMVDDEQLKLAVQKIFGSLTYKHGVLQRTILADIVFKDSDALKKLNALVHPVVKQRFLDWCLEQKTAIVVKEAAILFESDSHIGLDAVICVSADEQLRIDRVIARDGLTVEAVKSRIEKQMPQSEKEALSNYVIVNDGVQLLLPQVLAIIKEME